MENQCIKLHMSIYDQNKNENSNHIESFFEYATMGNLVTDSSGIITAINPFALKEFGYTEKELIGKTIETLIPSRFHNKHIHHREKYSQTLQNRPMGVGMDLFALKKDGTEFPVQVGLGNYHFNGDDFVIAFISNMSLRKNAEAEIIKLNNELEATVEQRTMDFKTNHAATGNIKGPTGRCTISSGQSFAVWLLQSRQNYG